MCLLIKKNQKILIADSDIKCYKFVEDLNNDGNLTTPYRYFTIKIGETYTSEIERDYDAIEIALHSYVNLEDAEKEIYNWAAIAHLVECTIPKGAKYIKGIFCCEEAYASDTITYNKIIKTCLDKDK